MSGHALSMDLNYFLRIDEQDAQLLARYGEVLTQGAADFAAAYYDYLFASPATAKALYRYEREGGDIGTLVRKQCHHMLSLLSGQSSADSAATAMNPRVQVRMFTSSVT